VPDAKAQRRLLLTLEKQMAEFVTEHGKHRSVADHHEPNGCDASPSVASADRREESS